MMCKAGVIYINHNFATESEADQALNEETDAQGATYYHVMLTVSPAATATCTPVQIFTDNALTLAPGKPTTRT
jgi:hypothetical protein